MAGMQKRHLRLDNHHYIDVMVLFAGVLRCSAKKKMVRANRLLPKDWDTAKKPQCDT